VTHVALIRLDRSVSKNTIPSRKIPGVPTTNRNDNAYVKRNGTVEVVNAGAASIPGILTVRTSNDTTTP
jgi:hypothetical protein